MSVAYVIGMALSYTLAGVAAGLSGNLMSQSLQNPWVLGATALVFVLLSFSMFGMINLNYPPALKVKCSTPATNLKVVYLLRACFFH